MTDFVDVDVLIYLNLLQRRCYILLHSGVSWKPEYGPELEAIDQQLAVYRSRIDNKTLPSVAATAAVKGTVEYRSVARICRESPLTASEVPKLPPQGATVTVAPPA